MISIILLGPPGVGKGTQASLLAEKYDIKILSTGELLRKAVSDKTQLGLRIKSIIENGELVSDDVVSELVEKKIREDSDVKGYILDGYPRTVSQAEYLKKLLLVLRLPEPYIISLQLEDEKIVTRLLSRFYCKDCNACYSSLTLKTKIEGVCDVCGGKEFYKRADDNEASVKVRLNAYNDRTAPLIKYYSGEANYISINSDNSVDAIHSVIGQRVSNIFTY